MLPRPLSWLGGVTPSHSPPLDAFGVSLSIPSASNSASPYFGTKVMPLTTASLYVSDSVDPVHTYSMLKRHVDDVENNRSDGCF